MVLGQHGLGFSLTHWNPFRTEAQQGQGHFKLITSDFMIVQFCIMETTYGMILFYIMTLDVFLSVGISISGTRQCLNGN